MFDKTAHPQGPLLTKPLVPPIPRAHCLYCLDCGWVRCAYEWDVLWKEEGWHDAFDHRHVVTVIEGEQP